MVFRIALLIVLAAPAAAAAQEPGPQEDAAPQVQEKETRILFPAWLEVLGDPEAEPPEEPVRHHLLGTGVREKTIFRVNVYGFGVYLDRAGAREQLAEAAADLPLEQALAGDGLANALMHAEVGKTLRLELARNVDGADIAEAFDESLEPRVRRFAPSHEARGNGLEALRIFRGYFDSGKLREGTVLQFTWEPGGGLHVSIDGAAQPVLEDATLARSLFDVYLGDDPVTPKAREQVLRAAWSLAARRPPDPEERE